MKSIKKCWFVDLKTVFIVVNKPRNIVTIVKIVVYFFLDNCALKENADSRYVFKPYHRMNVT